MRIRIHYRHKFHHSKLVLNEFILDPVRMMPNQREFMTFETLTPLDENVSQKRTMERKNNIYLNFWRWLNPWTKAEFRVENPEPGQAVYSRMTTKSFRL